MKTNEPFLSEVAPVARALETWRKTRKPGQSIPEPLWRQMAALGRRHGISRVCQALGLDYHSLKGRVEESAGAPDFVEVKTAPPSDHPPGCTAQLEDGRGRKVLLRWSSCPGPELLGVVQAFWNPGS